MDKKLEEKKITTNKKEDESFLTPLFKTTKEWENQLDKPLKIKF